MTIRVRLLLSLLALAAGIVAVVVVALLAAPIARADGDPASDYLLGQSTFVPPDDGVPKAYADQLNATVAEAKARGYKVRVALIGQRYDLGSVSILWKKPNQYAPFLAQELWFVYRGRVLVVMPNGYAIARHKTLIASEQRSLEQLQPPGPNGAALASSATRAVVKLAANAGIVIEAAPLASSGRGSSMNRDRLEIAGIVLVIVLLLAAIELVRRRRRKPA